MITPLGGIAVVIPPTVLIRVPVGRGVLILRIHVLVVGGVVLVAAGTMYTVSEKLFIP